MHKSAEPDSASGLNTCGTISDFTAAQHTTQACHEHVADTEVLFILHSNMLWLAHAG